MIKYWLKIVNSEDNKYIKCIYDTMLSDIDRNHRITNWALLVRNLLVDLGFYEVWLKQNIGNPVNFLSLVKQILHDNFLQKWNTEINGSTNAIFTRIFLTLIFSHT